MKSYKAFYFDGKTAKSHEVELFVHLDQIEIKASPLNKFFKVSEVQSEAPFKNGPLSFQTLSGERVEIQDYDHKLMELLLKKPSKIMLFIERNKMMLTGVVLSSLVFGYFFATRGIPMISHYAAGLINQKILNQMDKHILNTLDARLLSKSRLSEKTKQDLKDYFLQNELRKDIEIHFRRGSRLGANALALAGKTVIITDELVKKLSNKKLLYTIYLHEKGHLEHRHMARRMIQVSIYNFILFFLTNDMEGATEKLANVGATLISLSYSRDDEREADDYSIENLNRFEISPLCFSKAMNLFVNNSKEYASVKNGRRDFLSTHPNPGERIEKPAVLFPDAKDCQDQKYVLEFQGPAKPSKALEDILNSP